MEGHGSLSRREARLQASRWGSLSRDIPPRLITYVLRRRVNVEGETVANHSEQDAPTLRDYLRIIWLRKWVVVACVLLFVGVALGLSLMKPKVYSATASMMYSPPSDPANPGSATSVDLNNLTIQLQSVGNTLNGPKVRSQAAEGLSPKERADPYTVTATVVAPVGTSTNAIADTVDVTALAGLPKAAADIANAYANAVIDLRKTDQQEGIREAQRVIEQQLEVFQSAQSKLSPDYASLSLQLRDLKLAEATATGDFVILAPATPPVAPASPKPVKSAIVGFSAGLFLGILMAFVLGQFDVRVRTYREVATELGLNVIGRIPRLPQHGSRADELVALSDPQGSFSESLRVLRSNLEWVNIDEHLRVLLVSSCQKGEGKTVALCNLAVTLARSGKNVVVIDADLRGPRVHRLFRLPNTSGLTTVALGQVGLDSALQRFAEPNEVRVRTSVAPAVPPGPSGGKVTRWEGSLRILIGTAATQPRRSGRVQERGSRHCRRRAAGGRLCTR